MTPQQTFLIVLISFTFPLLLRLQSAAVWVSRSSGRYAVSGSTTKKIHVNATAGLLTNSDRKKAIYPTLFCLYKNYMKQDGRIQSLGVFHPISPKPMVILIKLTFSALANFSYP